MIWGIFIFALFGAVCCQDLPSPVVDLTTLSLTPTRPPWQSVCCWLPKEIYYHFKYCQIDISTIKDRISYDVDYFCDDLAYSITQLIGLQRAAIHDCSTVSIMITKLVAQKMLKVRAKTVTTVFNSAVLHTFKSLAYNLIDAPTGNSVLSVMTRVLTNNGVSKNEIDYIQRRMSFVLHKSLTKDVTMFLERLELSHVLIGLDKLQNDIMRILNVTNTPMPTNQALAQIRSAVISLLENPISRCIDSYTLRAYYIAYFNAVLSSMPANLDIEFMEHIPALDGIPAPQGSMVMNSVQVALKGVSAWIGGFVQAIVSRSGSGISQAFSVSGSQVSVSFVSGLVDRLGWVSLRVVPEHKNLLEEYKRILVQIAQYEAALQSMESAIQNLPPSERQYHQQSIVVVQKLLSALQKSLHDNSWVDSYQLKLYPKSEPSGSFDDKEPLPILR